jgi:hypothetical protein
MLKADVSLMLQQGPAAAGADFAGGGTAFKLPPAATAVVGRSRIESVAAAHSDISIAIGVTPGGVR